MTITSASLSIVIPNFNGQKLLAENLPKIIKMFPEFKILIVDDGSSDGSVNFLKSHFPKITVLINQHNMGFSSSANRGIKAAKTSLVWLLNNDCYPENNFLDKIIPYFQDPKVFAVSCAENNKGVIRGRGIGGFRKGLLYHRPGKLNKNNTLWAFGASTIYNKDLFLKLDGFDENYNPFYWEDFDLSYRVLKSGYKIYFEKQAMVNHQESSTISQNFSASLITQISFRNQLLTCWKNITDLDMLISNILWLPYHLILTSFRTKGAFIIGFILALEHFFDILHQRKKNKFFLTDKEVLAPFQAESELSFKRKVVS